MAEKVTVQTSLRICCAGRTGSWWPGIRSIARGKEQEMNETLKVLTERRSVRSYKDAGAGRNTAADSYGGRICPSGMGMQPVVMAVVQDKETIRQLSRMNAAVMGNDSDPFMVRQRWVGGFADSRRGTCGGWKPCNGQPDECRFLLGVDSCWIHRAREVSKRRKEKPL